VPVTQGRWRRGQPISGESKAFLRKKEGPLRRLKKKVFRQRLLSRKKKKGDLYRSKIGGMIPTGKEKLKERILTQKKKSRFDADEIPVQKSSPELDHGNVFEDRRGKSAKEKRRAGRRDPLSFREGNRSKKRS